MTEVKQVLIIDDDYDDREMLTEVIQEMLPKAQCTSATNGLEGLAILTKPDDAPEIIFLDLNMPKMNGLQFLVRIKDIEKCKAVPVVIYSTANDLIARSETEKLGASWFLTKPSSSNVLKYELQKIFLHFSLNTNADI